MMFYTFPNFVVLYYQYDVFIVSLVAVSSLIIREVSLPFRNFFYLWMIHLIVLSQVVQLILLSWWTLMLVVFQLSVTILIIAYLIDLEVFVLQ